MEAAEPDPPSPRPRWREHRGAVMVSAQVEVTDRFDAAAARSCSVSEHATDLPADALKSATPGDDRAGGDGDVVDQDGRSGR